MKEGQKYYRTRVSYLWSVSQILPKEPLILAHGHGASAAAGGALCGNSTCAAAGTSNSGTYRSTARKRFAIPVVEQKIATQLQATPKDRIVCLS